MRRLLSLALGASLLFSATAALATFPSPSSLLWAWENARSAFSYSAEFHLHAEDTWAAAWVKGQSQMADKKLSADITVDVHAPKEQMKLRAKMSVILVGDDAYFKLVSLDDSSGRVKNDVPDGMLGRWIAFSSTQSGMTTSDEALQKIQQQLAAEGITVTEEELKQFVSDLLDSILQMESKKTAKGMDYAIGLRRDFLEGAMQVIQSFQAKIGKSDTFPASPAGELRKTERDILKALTFKLTIQTNAADQPIGSSVAVNFSIPKEKIQVTGKGVATPAASVTVTAPINAIPFEEFQQKFSGSTTMPSAPSKRPVSRLHTR